MPTGTPDATGGRPARGLWAILLALTATTACDDPTGVEPDPAVAPFVGDWEAASVVLTNLADPEAEPVDLIELGATFTLNVQPSGKYTAILTYLGQPITQIGQMRVADNVVTLDVTTPPDDPTTSGTFEFDGPDAFTLEGETQFDFNLDGEDEEALVTIEFVRA